MTAAESNGLDTILFELLATPEGRADPYPRYATLRRLAPVYRSGMGSWITTRYDDCQHVLRSPHFGKQESATDVARARAKRMAHWEIEAKGLEDAVDLRSRQSILTLNPPDHTRLRALVSRAFTPSTVEALRPHVTFLCDELLAAAADYAASGETVDIMTALAFPLPSSVIGELLGVPPPDRAQFQSLVRHATAALEPAATLDHLVAAHEARLTMETYFRSLVAERRRRPADDLLSQLISVRDGSDRLSEDELIATAILLFAAGFETTTNLIGNGLLALLRHPDQLDALRRAAVGGDGPAVARAVEELLRWDSPVQLDVRIAFEDTVLGDERISAGDSVMTLLG
ncbi:MAG TPA: cytochrome P450, partial [Acidimicrobiales bacterium]|nr:cytochrome P450 [Acidimicrobiales bacterium]